MGQVPTLRRHLDPYRRGHKGLGHSRVGLLAEFLLTKCDVHLGYIYIYVFLFVLSSCKNEQNHIPAQVQSPRSIRYYIILYVGFNTKHADMSSIRYPPYILVNGVLNQLIPILKAIPKGIQD